MTFDNTKGMRTRVVLTMYILPHPDPKPSTKCCWTDWKGRESSPALLEHMEIGRNDRRATNKNIRQLEKARIKPRNMADR